MLGCLHSGKIQFFFLPSDETTFVCHIVDIISLQNQFLVAVSCRYMPLCSICEIYITIVCKLFTLNPLAAHTNNKTLKENFPSFSPITYFHTFKNKCQTSIFHALIQPHFDQLDDINLFKCHHLKFSETYFTRETWIPALFFRWKAFMERKKKLRKIKLLWRNFSEYFIHHKARALYKV